MEALGRCQALTQLSVNTTSFPTAFSIVPPPQIGTQCGIIERVLDLESKIPGDEAWFFHSLAHDLGQVT